jgi:hypothetical protein
VQGVLFVTDDDRVTSVVSTVELDDVVDPTRDEVRRLAFTFVAPLGTNDNDGGHDGSFV